MNKISKIMNFWRYKYFVDVVEQGNFTKAGKINYVSQTAISQQVAAFEKEIGGKLKSYVLNVAS